jgi:hypothetical protein
MSENEMVERVAAAIREAPTASIRTSKSNRVMHEVFWVDTDEPLSEESIHVVGAYADHASAEVRCRFLETELQARAALVAMREPATKVLAAGVAEYADPKHDHTADEDTVRDTWRAMIDAALKG